MLFFQRVFFIFTFNFDDNLLPVQTISAFMFSDNVLLRCVFRYLQVFILFTQGMTKVTFAFLHQLKYRYLARALLCVVL